MSLADSCPFQPLPCLGGRYSSVFTFEGISDDQCIQVWDLRRAAASLHGMKAPESSRFTAYDLLVTKVDPLCLLVDEVSWIVPRSTPTTMAPWVIEVCACSGAMGLGPMFMGANVLASFELNDLAIDHLRRNKHGMVFQGDLTNDADIRAFHALIHDKHYGLLAGFPCQPFSVQGRQRGHDDPRSLVYWAVLRAMALLGAEYGLLECVTQAATDPVIQAGLQAFVEVMQWQSQQTILELSQQWAMHRRRWWAALLSCDWPTSPIPSWSTTSSQITIGHVLPAWGEWSEFDERDLQLSMMELQAYTNPCYGKEPRLLTGFDVGPTVLHSYGSALYSCPCKCRSAGFSPSTLASRGLRGVFVVSETTGQARYLHPHELSVLLSIPLTVSWGPSPRKALCLLGQCAAPLQSLWMFSHMVKAAALKYPDVRHIHPGSVIAKYKAELMRQIAQSFPSAKYQGPQCLQLRGSDGHVLHIVKEGLITAGSLLMAERINLQWGQIGRCYEQDLSLDEDAILNPGTEYSLEHRDKKQKKVVTCENVMICIQHRGHGFTSLFPVGSFIFMALREHHIEDTTFLVDEDGKLYGPDFRVWRSLFLHTVHQQGFPHLAVGSVVPPLGVDMAYGPQTDGSGLNVATLWRALQGLVLQVREVNLMRH